jgi:ABC-type transporter lipoprotein component MlaA
MIKRIENKQKQSAKTLIANRTDDMKDLIEQAIAGYEMVRRIYIRKRTSLFILTTIMMNIGIVLG